MLMESLQSESAQQDAPEPDVLERLRELCVERGLDGLATNLGELGALVKEDMTQISEQLDRLESQGSLAEQAAQYLMGVGGKRLRPMCVALAARVGNGLDQRTLDLAVSVELVHNATLLHDDVIDLAPSRRGLPTARSEFGNAASIFGGDWLLVEALRRVLGANVADTLPRLLDTIDTMIRAESLQLERRGTLNTTEDVYFRIVEGKSAVLFRWALYAGARAGGLETSDCEALERFGSNLGVAFQIIDDLLDFTGHQADTGKALFTDLREGKMTYPLILACTRDEGLLPLLRRVCAVTDEGKPVDAITAAAVLAKLEETRALEDSRTLAEQRIEAALEALRGVSVEGSEAVAALALVAQSTLHRDR